MSWKKNIFSYLLWVLYAVAAEVGLVCLADAACDSRGLELYIGTLACALYIIAAGLGVYLVHRFAPKYSETAEKKHSAGTLIETVVTVLLLGIGFFLRVQMVGGPVEENTYFELAAMVSEEEIPRSAHGAVSFYIQMLHGLFYFLGNKPAVAVWVQILLQMSAILLLYFAVRRAAGSIAAIVMLGFGTFSSYLSEAASDPSPAMLYLLCWSAVLLLTVTAAGAQKRLWSFPVIGFVIAFVSYLDVAGCLLLFISGAVIFSEEEMSGTGRRLKCLLLCLAGAAAGFAGCALADSVMSGKTFLEALTGWGQLYRPSDFRLPVSVNVTAAMAEGMVEYIILFCVLTLGMFSFWRNRKSDPMKAWILLLIVLIAAGCFGIFTEEMPMGLYMYLLLAIMAGIAVKECICEIKPASGAVLVSAENSLVDEQRILQQGGDAGSQIRGQTESDGGTVLPQREAADDASQSASRDVSRPGKVKLIENPLPLPKKHIRKKLDYDVNISSGEDDFDLDVDEKDDFDI